MQFTSRALNRGVPGFCWVTRNGTWKVVRWVTQIDQERASARNISRFSRCAARLAIPGNGDYGVLSVQTPNGVARRNSVRLPFSSGI
jgi:hypothetical protein